VAVQVHDHGRAAMATDGTDCDPPGDGRRGSSDTVREKDFRHTFLAACAAAAVILIAGSAHSFHSGGVGNCEGCHSLHSSPGVPTPDPDDESGAASATSPLLAGKDPSSTCLRCHSDPGAAYNVFHENGSAYTPGGDFAWLRKTFRWTDDGKPHLSPGESHGHSVVAVEFGLAADGRFSAAPWGTYLATAMSCISCHDPHGRISGSASGRTPIGVSGSYGETPSSGTVAGNYRLLGGVGYAGGGSGSGTPFVQPAPVAVASPADWRETDTNHPAYGSGMSEWCANCHPSLESDGTGKGKSHPAGNNVKLGSSIVSAYIAYVKTGDVSGSRPTAYLALVPFERGTDDRSLLDPSSTEGPDSKANVMCLTCHRAHASAFPNAGRWDFRATFLAKSHPQAGDAGAAGNDHRESYYGRDIVARFGPYQRSLCNKCHLKD
jgi:hypothetical protein